MTQLTSRLRSVCVAAAVAAVFVPDLRAADPAPNASGPAMPAPSTVTPGGTAAGPLPAPGVAQGASKDAPEYSFTLGGYANYAFDASLRDAGEFSVFRSGGSVTIDRALPSNNELRLFVNGEYNHYYFHDFNSVPGADGSDSLDAYQFDIRPSFTHVGQDWTWYVGLSLTAAGMAEAHVDDALSYGAFAGATYKFSPDFSLGLGLAVTTQLEDDALVVPLVTLDWAISPQWHLSGRGLSAKLAYQWSPELSTFVSASYDFRQFRLDGHEVISNGVLTDQALPITLGVTYKLDDRFTVTGEAGVVAYRRLEIRDSGGDQVGADEADPALFLSVQAEYRF